MLRFEKPFFQQYIFGMLIAYEVTFATSKGFHKLYNPTQVYYKEYLQIIICGSSHRFILVSF